MNIRDALRQTHATLNSLSVDMLDRLEETLEEELALVKTIKAVKAVLARKGELLNHEAEPFTPLTDLNEMDRSEPEPGPRQPRTRAKSGACSGVTAAVAEYLRENGPQTAATVAEYFRGKFPTGAAVQALKISVRFYRNSKTNCYDLTEKANPVPIYASQTKEA